MFLLKKSDGTVFYLMTNRTYTIGRHKCDFTLDSKDISRHHVTIFVKNKNVFVQHMQPSNHTSINGDVLEVNREYHLPVGSTVKLGKDHNFILQNDVLVVTTTGMIKKDKIELKSLVERRGGAFASGWSCDTTHVVVDDFVLTVSACSALINKTPIVHRSYFQDCWDSIEQSKPLPALAGYLPKPSVDMVKSGIAFNFDLDRRWLFKDKVFLFRNAASAQKIEGIVKMASGKVMTIEDDGIGKEELVSGRKDYALVTTDSDDGDAVMERYVEHIRRFDQRPIPVSEIPAAILSNSCQSKCNPKFNKLGHLMSATRADISTSVLVHETQSQPRSPPDFGSPPSKRMCTRQDVKSSQIEDKPRKRKAEGDLQLVKGHSETLKSAKLAPKVVKLNETIIKKGFRFQPPSSQPPTEEPAKDTPSSEEIATTTTIKESPEVEANVSFKSLQWKSKAADDDQEQTFNEEDNGGIRVVIMAELSFSKLSILHETTCNRSSTQDTTSSRMNFKKFSKVQPKCLQSTIISAKNLIPVRAGGDGSSESKAPAKEKKATPRMDDPPTSPRDSPVASTSYDNSPCNVQSATPDDDTPEIVVQPKKKKKKTGFVFNFNP